MKHYYIDADALPMKVSRRGEVETRRNRALQDGAFGEDTALQRRHRPIQRSYFHLGHEGGTITMEALGRWRRPQAPPPVVCPKPNRAFTTAHILRLRLGGPDKDHSYPPHKTSKW